MQNNKRSCCFRRYPSHQECGYACLACQEKPLTEQGAVDSSRWQSSSSGHRSLAAEHLLGKSLLPATRASRQQATSHTLAERHTSANASDCNVFTKTWHDAQQAESQLPPPKAVKLQLADSDRACRHVAVTCNKCRTRFGTEGPPRPPIQRMHPKMTCCCNCRHGSDSTAQHSTAQHSTAQHSTKLNTA